MPDHDTLTTTDPAATERQEADLYRAYRHWRTMMSDWPIASVLPIVPVGWLVGPWMRQVTPQVENQVALTGEGPTAGETPLPHEVEMVADIDRIIARLDEKIPRAIASMDQLLAKIHAPSKRSAA